MLKFTFDQPRTILCLGAHADDVEIGCGGTILRILAEHKPVDVHWIVLSAQGRRAEEARRGAERLLRNAAERKISVESFRDSYFPYLGGQIKSYIEKLREEIDPDLIFTHYRHDLHQDHRLVSELTWCAFRDHLILEYEIPKYDGDLGNPNLYVPIEESTCREKIQAIGECFPTQHAKNWFSDDTYWALLRLRGVECHSPSKFAEGFFARKITC